MPNPFNLAIAYQNLADAGTITANSSVPLLPPSRLQNPHIAKKWRSDGNSGEYLLVDLGAARVVDTIALMGSSQNASGTARVRISTTDATGAAGDAYDSQAITQAVDARFAMFVHLIPTTRTGRYVRIDLTSPSSAYIEVGRLFVGLRYQFTYNYSPGWTLGYVDLSEKSKSRGGQTYISPRADYRTASLSLDFVLQSERNSFVMEIDRVNGTSTDILLITRPDSDNLARDSIWGLVTELDPISQPQLAWVGPEAIFAKSYRVEERL